MRPARRTRAHVSSLQYNLVRFAICRTGLNPVQLKKSCPELWSRSQSRIYDLINPLVFFCSECSAVTFSRMRPALVLGPAGALGKTTTFRHARCTRARAGRRKVCPCEARASYSSPGSPFARQFCMICYFSLFFCFFSGGPGFFLYS